MIVNKLNRSYILMLNNIRSRILKLYDYPELVIPNINDICNYAYHSSSFNDMKRPINTVINNLHNMDDKELKVIASGLFRYKSKIVYRSSEEFNHLLNKKVNIPQEVQNILREKVENAYLHSYFIFTKNDIVKYHLEEIEHILSKCGLIPSDKLVNAIKDYNNEAQNIYESVSNKNTLVK